MPPADKAALEELRGSVIDFPRAKPAPLKAPGCGRDAENEKALFFIFSRRVTDNEMCFLHEVVQRAVACMPIEIEAHHE